MEFSKATVSRYIYFYNKKIYKIYFIKYYIYTDIVYIFLCENYMYKISFEQIQYCTYLLCKKKTFIGYRKETYPFIVYDSNSLNKEL